MLIPFALLAIVLIGRAMLPGIRRYRMISELHRDWWPRFERDLRQYMSQTWRSARDAERRP